MPEVILFNREVILSERKSFFSAGPSPKKRCFVPANLLVILRRDEYWFSFPMSAGRIMAIDYGRKRTGLAVTDPAQMIATRLTTVESVHIWAFLEEYFSREKVVLVVVGYPLTMNNEASEAVKYINPFIRSFLKKFPGVRLEQVDERFTSRLAMRAMIDGGVSKSGRRDKALVDGVSATIILQSYLEQKKNCL